MRIVQTILLPLSLEVLIKTIDAGLIKGNNEVTEPTISFISKHQVKEIGDRSILHCIVTSINTFPVLWFHFPMNGKPPMQLTSGNRVIVPNSSRFKLFVNSSYTSYSLEIENLKREDSGIYQCIIIYNLKEKYSKEVTLNVVNPMITHISEPLMTKLGEMVTLECTTFTTLADPILWVHYNNSYYIDSYLSNYNNVTIRNRIHIGYYKDKSIHSLRLVNLSYNDSGVYECLLLSHLPEKIYKTTRITVV